MENVALVTINERFAGKLKDSKKLFFLNALMHELSHMWFGNLVTMQWWDDLWLNESFATFMSFLALE